MFFFSKDVGQRECFRSLSKDAVGELATTTLALAGWLPIDKINAAVALDPEGIQDTTKKKAKKKRTVDVKVVDVLAFPCLVLAVMDLTVASDWAVKAADTDETHEPICAQRLVAQLHFEGLTRIIELLESRGGVFETTLFLANDARVQFKKIASTALSLVMESARKQLAEWDAAVEAVDGLGKITEYSSEDLTDAAKQAFVFQICTSSEALEVYHDWKKIKLHVIKARAIFNDFRGIQGCEDPTCDSNVGISEDQACG